MEKLLLISLKDKNSQTSGKVYAVKENSLGQFISKYLTPDTIILIDTVDSFCSDSEE